MNNLDYSWYDDWAAVASPADMSNAISVETDAPPPLDDYVPRQSYTEAVPVVGSEQQVSPFRGLLQVLGTVGQTARDVGTAVGTVQRTVASVPKQYESARAGAQAGIFPGIFNNMSGTDKIMIVIGLAGLYLMVKK